MLFFKKAQKQELDSKAKKFVEELNGFRDSCNDENMLNKMFTEVTILRMELDGKDSLWQNFKDFRKRKQNIGKKELIKVQFRDIIENYGNYDSEQLKQIDAIMNIVFKNVSVPKSWWQTLWGDICKAINVM